MPWRTFVLACALACWSQAQDQVHIVPRAQPTTQPADFRVDSSLVLIPVHVTTPLGASVTTLTRDNFRLFEDGREQTISVFAHDDAPVSVGLLFDASGSMKNKRLRVAEAAEAFFKTANPQDEFFLIEFNDYARLSVPFTGDGALICSRIAGTHPWGRTALLDAVQLALRQMRKAARQRKALVILSDGGDNWSRHKARHVENALLESDVQVYAMGIFDSNLDVSHPPEERDGPHLLEDLTELTGGRLYPVADIDTLPAIGERISRQLRNQYLLGYSSTQASRDGKYRRVRVKLLAPDGMPELRASYRTGYYGTE